MPDAMFAHPRLAPLYDAFESGRSDLHSYVEIADELGAARVLDVGCGTGSLAILLEGTGRTVVGTDPAEASLAVARSKDGSARIVWVRCDATVLPTIAADLVVMTGNVAQVFRTDEEWTRVLLSVRAALRPGTHFVFETRKPERRDWERWPGTTSVDVPELGRVERHDELTDASPPLISFRSTYRFPDGEELTSESTLRFRTRDEIDASLAEAGFVLREVREAPDRAGLEDVYIARRAD
ncbi:class I SAM-dependent methyltransferase [Saccharopolyspora sp. NPDC049426]|uniref:class I SAM-dependent methyltransferase n=1 Tax=Saccharopolyspora sp. NPDC049426 TaxID=3155652 RepID=UPI0034253805